MLCISASFLPHRPRRDRAIRRQGEKKEPAEKTEPAVPAAEPKTETTTETTEAAAIPTTHTIRSGDNPWTISQKYGVSMKELLELNNIKNVKNLQIGQVLKLPKTAKLVKTTPAPAPATPAEEFDPGDYEVYTIKKGDNPWNIAKKLKIDYQALMDVNKDINPRDLKIGQKLRLPKKGQKSSEGISGSLSAVPTATPEPAPAAEPAEKPFDADGHEVYVIKKGDNPWAIAKRLKIDYQALLDANKDINPRDLKIGQKLRLPKKKQ